MSRDIDDRGILVDASEAAEQRPPGHGPMLLMVILALIVGIVYLAFPARLFMGEGFKWALSGPDQSSGLFSYYHPHHLIYNPLGHLFHGLLKILKPGLPAMISFRLMDTVFGLGGVLLFFSLAIRLLRQAAAAFCAALGFAFSWGFWSHAVNVEVYAAGLFFILLSLRLSVPLIERRDPPPLLWVSLGISTALAALLHQSNVLLLTVPLAAAIMHQHGRRTGLSGFLRLFLPVYTALTVIPYLAVMVFHQNIRSTGEAVRWLFMYGHQLDRYLGTDPNVFRLAAISLGRSILLPSTYTSAESQPIIPAPALLGLKAGCVLLMLLLLAGLCFTRFQGPVKRRWVVMMTAFAAPYVVFFTFWDPGGYFFWLPLTVPVWLLLGASAAGPGGKVMYRLSRPALCGLVLLLFLLNFTGGILPESDPERVDDHRLLQFVHRHVDQQSLILLNAHHMEVIANFGGPMFHAYASAFSPIRVESLLPRILESAERERFGRRIVETAMSGVSLYYLNEILHARRTDEGRDLAVREFFTSLGFEPKLSAVHDGQDAYQGTVLYRLFPLEPAVSREGPPASR